MAVETAQAVQLGSPTTLPVRRRFSVAEYNQMGAAGIFDENERVELIEGEIYAMTPIGTAHASCVKRLNQLLSHLVGHDALVGVQDPIVIGGQSEPQPDLAVLRPRADAYAAAHPTPADIIFLIEVADTTLAYDRGAKLRLYAGAAVPEVWIVDLTGEQVERHSEPRGGVYRQVVIAQRGESLASVGLPQVVIPIDAVLGPTLASVTSATSA